MAKRYIDVDEAVKALCRKSFPGFSKAVNIIKEVPVADVVQVVRCRDCKYSGYKYHDFRGTEIVVCWKDGYGIRKSANGYCDDGDFRDDKEGEQNG